VTVLCDRVTYVTEMSKAMPTASPALVEDHELVDRHRPPPPTYERSMGQDQIIPPGTAPYPQQNGK
jgi:hypothetical protein